MRLCEHVAHICFKFVMVTTSCRRHGFNYFHNYISFEMIPWKLFLISIKIHTVELELNLSSMIIF
jgi:hypothetical protein